MNTILTDDEAYELGQAHHLSSVKVRAIEDALLAKLRAQEPLGFVTSLQWRAYQSEQVRKITRTAQPEYGFTVPIYAVPLSTMAKSKEKA